MYQQLPLCATSRSPLGFDAVSHRSGFFWTMSFGFSSWESHSEHTGASVLASIPGMVFKSQAQAVIA
jgi:hypothetical protein